MAGQSALARTRSAPSAPTTSSLLVRTRTGAARPGIELRAIGGGSSTRETLPAVVSKEDAFRAVKRVDLAIVALDNDMHNQFVWGDPVALEAAATAWEASAASKYFPGKAAELRRNADEMRARAKDKSAAQIAAEQKFAKDYGEFTTRWSVYKKSVGYPDDMSSWGPVTGPALVVNEVIPYERTYNDFHGRFTDLSGKPSQKKLEETTVPGLIPPLFKGAGKALFGEYFTPVLIICGLLAAGWLLTKVVSAKQAFSASKAE